MTADAEQCGADGLHIRNILLQNRQIFVDTLVKPPAVTANAFTVKINGRRCRLQRHIIVRQRISLCLNCFSHSQTAVQHRNNKITEQLTRIDQQKGRQQILKALLDNGR